MQNISNRLNNLSPSRRALLERLLRQQQEHFNTFPVSFTQQSMWVLNQLAVGTASYSVLGGLHFTGSLHLQTIERVLTEIVNRHEALRTTFPAIEGRPVQAIQPPSRLSLPLIDLAQLPSDEREEVLQGILDREARRSFDLATGPLFRTLLIRLAAQEHILLVEAHHIVLDGWSLGVLTQELTQLYEAYAAGLPSLLPPLPVQYADFAQWQREWLESPLMSEQLAYWKEQLHAPLPVLEFPTDHPRPQTQTFAGSLLSFTLSSRLYRELLSLSAQEEATLFMTLATAFTILLARYTGQTDLIFGTPIAYRTRVELEGLIGCFVNTLALRVDTAHNPRVRELLRQMRRVTLDAYANQDVPFEKIVEELQPERDPGRNPLFQMMFVLQNTPMPEIKLRDLTVKALSVSRQIAELDLTLYIWETGEGLQGDFEYNTTLFDQATMARLIEHFQVLLEGMVRWPDLPVSSLPLLTENERALLLTDWNASTVVDPPSQCLHEIFEAQTKRAPDVIALVDGEECLTYQALNERASYLAWRLRNLGIGPEIRVGVCLERSLALITALLGVLKAGGTSVPLDPTYPRERLLFILEDAQCAMVIGAYRLQPALAAANVPVLWLDELPVDQRQADLHASSVFPQNAAYIIYTSGSTGRPKGVIVQHQSVVSFVEAARHLYALTTNDRLLQFASISFDISVEEIYVSLASGATLVLRDELMLSSIPLFLEMCQQWGITVLDLPTAYWHELMANLEHASFVLPLSLRLVIIGGERALPESLALWQKRGEQGLQLINTYGPTETTVVATAWTLSKEQSDTSLDEVPIGRTIGQGEVYVLDRFAQLVPIGVPGELYIGGVRLARGYQHGPDLTAERFVPHPYSARTGERLYRTGDLVRLREDGTLVYLGRTDMQVKVRGYRVEPGEIEAVLSKHPAIYACAVIATEENLGDRRLVAYVVAREQNIGLEELRLFLRERLPEYMVPTGWIMLDSLPLTPNGKVDRRALPVAGVPCWETKKQYQAPRTFLEMQLARIWARVLKQQQIGIQDNFFEAGGHSLLALQAMAYMREEMHLSLVPASFFLAPTIAEMAALLTGQEEQVFSCLVPIKKAEGRPPLFCLHPAGGEVWLYQELADLLERDQPIYGVQSQALQVSASEQTSIQSMARTYMMALRERQPEGPYHLFGWSMGGVLAVAVAAELEQAGQQVAFVGLLDAYLAAEEQERDPLEGLGAAFAGSLFQAFALLSVEEQAELRSELLALSGNERVKRALVWGKERRSLPDYISEETLAAQVALIETHSLLLTDYCPPIIEAPMIVWWAQEEQSEPEARTDWRRYTRGEVLEEVIEGNHFTVIRVPFIELVARHLNRFMQTGKMRELTV